MDANETSTPTARSGGIKTAAIVAGAIAAGVGAYTFATSRRRHFGKDEKETKEWLHTSFNELVHTLRLDLDKAKEAQGEIEECTKTLFKLQRASLKAKPHEQEGLRLAMESRFLEMKKKLHRKLDLGATEIELLDRFYAELEVRIFHKAEEPKAEAASVH